MSKIFAIAKKDLRLEFSSFSALLFFLVLPLIFIFFMGGGIKSIGKVEPILIWVQDQDGSAAATTVAEIIDAADGYQVEMVLDDAQAGFNDSEAVVWVTLPAGFEEALKKDNSAEIDVLLAPNNNNALLAVQAVENAAQRVARPYTIAQAAVTVAEEKQPFADSSARADFAAAALSQAQATLNDSPQRINQTQPENTSDFGDDNLRHSTIGQIITWVFIPLMGTSAMLADERERGTFSRLIATPTSAATLLGGIVLGRLIRAAAQITLLLLFGAFAMGIDWGHDPLALALIFAAFALSAIALGTLMGTFVKTSAQANGLSVMFGMLFSLLGGAWFPIELFPPLAQKLSQALPTHWAMRGLRNLVIGGQGLTDILPIIAILLLFAIGFFAVGSLRFRRAAIS